MEEFFLKMKESASFLDQSTCIKEEIIADSAR